MTLIYNYIQENWLEVLGTLVGLLYLYQELKASVYLWITGIVMPAIYTVVYWEAGLYADFGIQIYYIVAAIYGLLFWKFFRSKSGNTLQIRHLPLKKYPYYAVIFVVAYVVIAYVLVTYTNSTVPYLDTFTTALSIVGLLLLARKYVEQWLAWIAVDGVCVGLYIYKEIYFTAGLYALYTVLAVYGYFVWRKGAYHPKAFADESHLP